ncbi:MAG: RNase adapter RapZ [Pseudomonadota bacterium]|nr:RNase adapter RapZ [Pseudomonadota bacterium]
MSDPARFELVIVSGRSGSGKSTALHVLEDLGFYAIDNLPAGLLATLAAGVGGGQFAEQRRVAVSIDARNVPSELQQLPGILAELQQSNLTLQTLYLDADEQTLQQRFSETRRRHPLSGAETGLVEAMAREAQLLQPVSAIADFTIDTSRLSIHQLREVVRWRFAGTPGDGFSLLFGSFGFKRGVPFDADLVYDARCLPNPHWVPELRSLTGRDAPVVAYLESHSDVAEFYGEIAGYLHRWLGRYERTSRSYLTVAVGCTGGQHRSVYLCEALAREFGVSRTNVFVRHRELGLEAASTARRT